MVGVDVYSPEEPPAPVHSRGFLLAGADVKAPSSYELLAKMRDGIDAIEKIMHDPRLPTTVQIADVDMGCWALVQMCHQLQEAVRKELSDLD